MFLNLRCISGPPLPLLLHQCSLVIFLRPHVPDDNDCNDVVVVFVSINGQP